MSTHPSGLIARSLSGTVLVLAFTHLLAGPARGEVDIFAKDDFSMALGLRIQTRMEFERVNAVGGGREWLRDFFVRRMRIKASGKLLDAKYKVEWKIDQTDRINGTPPIAQVENAYIRLPLVAGVDVQAGLYDSPFSRDLLTSDSRHLAVDRGAVSNVLSTLGLVDNAVGFALKGEIGEDRAEYAVGVFDNRTIPASLQDSPMAVGRLELNLGSTKNVYQDAHFGEDSWYSLGVNGSYQGAIENASNVGGGSNAAAGIDGMIDVPAGPARLFLRSECNVVKQVPPGGGNSVDTVVWMAGAGFLVLNERLQPFVRFDRVELDDAVGGGNRNTTFLGANLYRKGHSLKFQSDIRLEAGTGDAVDGGRFQAQIDF